jgi:hypothetical protein
VNHPYPSLSQLPRGVNAPAVSARWVT